MPPPRRLNDNDWRAAPRQRQQRFALNSRLKEKATPLRRSVALMFVEGGGRTSGPPPAFSVDYWNSLRMSWLLWLAIDSD
jgi:hypothetical protein